LPSVLWTKSHVEGILYCNSPYVSAEFNLARVPKTQADKDIIRHTDKIAIKNFFMISPPFLFYQQPPIKAIYSLEYSDA
jgi:hypothetical protein